MHVTENLSGFVAYARRADACENGITRAVRFVAAFFNAFFSRSYMHQRLSRQFPEREMRVK